MDDEASEAAPSADHREDALLLEAARRDRQAFGLLYDRYVDQIYHYVHRRVGETAVAEDLTAEVWERALGAIERYEDRGAPFSAWLYRIAGNVVANHYRQQRLRRLLPLISQGNAHDPRAEVDDRSVVRQALRALSASDQEVLSLHYYAGLTPAEMARVLDCAPGVVHKRLQRARERLRARIEGDSRVGR